MSRSLLSRSSVRALRAGPQPLRLLSTEPTKQPPPTPAASSDSSHYDPPSSSHPPSAVSRSTSSSPSLSRLSPGPRPLPSASQPPPIRYNPSVSSDFDHSFGTVLSHLPRQFGANQRLTVPDETRKVLEDVVSTFEAPIRYAFAYGSGVFKQSGYDKKSSIEPPMLDFIFAVSHADHWHSINMHQNPSHYPLAARLTGGSLVSRFQSISPGLWFNPYASVNGVTIKYGVISVETLTSDLLTWKTLYSAGRMHKPVRIIKDDPRIRLTQQVNLASALRTALLMLPEEFTEKQLFESIAWISYMGDPRMSGAVPLENRNKVANIVEKQSDLFRELYWKLASGIQGVHWQQGSSVVQQDNDPKVRVLRLRRLPVTLLQAIERHYASQPSYSNLSSDEGVFWLTVASDDTLTSVIQTELRQIVRGPSTVQSAKGVVTAGVGKSLRYGLTKVRKWWAGS
ncbi:Mitochondrial translocator assembly and maintenance protein 41 [Tulasnella sp. JGI-2019a]|nr:Mitochondrial translocator assembly and maintenance protein 41 [Tulasnella sp. JGI-2019a]